MTTESDDYTPSPFRSFVVLAGACLGLAGLMWLRQNLTPPPAGEAAAGSPDTGASSKAPSGASAKAPSGASAKAPSGASAKAPSGASAKAPSGASRKAPSATPPANENEPAEAATPQTAAPEAAAPAKTQATKNKATKNKPAKAKAAPASADDLTAIGGIGPKIAQVLAASGVSTYAELAGKTVDEIREILIAADPRYRMFDPASWPEQARAAAAGPN